MPLEKVIDQFQRDRHPERELLIWESITEKYHSRVKPWWDIYQKEDLLQELILESMEICSWQGQRSRRLMANVATVAK